MTVARHALPEYEEEADPLGQFQAEMVQAFKTKAGVPAVWMRGGVSLEVEGHSRLSTAMPQPMAAYQLTVAGGQTVRLAPDEVASWPRLWETVESALTAWTSAVQDRRRVYEAALQAEKDARAALFRARTAVEDTRRELAAVLPPGEAPATLTMSRDDVAEFLGIAPGSVARQMNRWGITPEYERGPHARRPQARYPRALV
ncbi:hypothetical protein [Streptomyces xiamenensis]|uniref:hypothetical protein n=1 Tax=Streptomyces xiamenensis TaxID=408015 RepID=UPI0035DEB87D